MISDIVIAEILKTKELVKRRVLLEVIEKYSLKILILDKTSDELAGIYIREKIIPPKKLPTCTAYCHCNMS